MKLPDGLLIHKASSSFCGCSRDQHTFIGLFQVGDEVFIITTGECGTVQKVDLKDSFHPYQIKVDYTYSWHGEHEITFIEPLEFADEAD